MPLMDLLPVGPRAARAEDPALQNSPKANATTRPGGTVLGIAAPRRPFAISPRQWAWTRFFKRIAAATPANFGMQDLALIRGGLPAPKQKTRADGGKRPPDYLPKCRIGFQAAAPVGISAA